MTLKGLFDERTLKKTNLSDLGSYYCSPSFFRTWSRKLAINMSRSLLSILSNSLGSFLETQNFFNNETSLCVLLKVVLFSWCYRNSSKEQPSDTNLLYFSFVPAIFWRKIRRRRQKAANSGKPFAKGWTTLIFPEMHLRCRWLVMLPHVKTTVRHSLSF